MMHVLALSIVAAPLRRKAEANSSNEAAIWFNNGALGVDIVLRIYPRDRCPSSGCVDRLIGRASKVRITSRTEQPGNPRHLATAFRRLSIS